MIIVDNKLKELEKNNTPIRIGLIGAGFAARGFANQIISKAVPALHLALVVNRTDSYAKQLFEEAGVKDFYKVTTEEEVTKAITNKQYIFTNDPFLATRNSNIDVIMEITGEIEYGSRVVMDAIAHKKHVVHLNAELDATLGPILKQYADKNGVIYAQADGDQPAVIINLMRHVAMLGLTPVVLGNIKSLIDTKRTPTTQEAFAREHFQRPKMITSFADGTKISAEMVSVANATGCGVAKRGMLGPKVEHVDHAYKAYDLHALREKGGVVDYILGAQPSFGIFVIGYTENPLRQRYLKVYKMGEGPYYTFYTPTHLGPLEAAISIGRAILFNDFPLVPKHYYPVCEMVAYAKKPLKKGDILDGVGGYTCYGVIENSTVARKENLLPMGLTDGCAVTRDVAEDAALTLADVTPPHGSLSWQLWHEQCRE